MTYYCILNWHEQVHMIPCCKGPIEGTFIPAQMTDKIWTENTVFRIILEAIFFSRTIPYNVVKAVY